MPIQGRQIHEGGWLEVPGVIAGRIRCLQVVPGTARYTVTFESGAQCEIGWETPVLFWDN